MRRSVWEKVSGTSSLTRYQNISFASLGSCTALCTAEPVFLVESGRPRVHLSSVLRTLFPHLFHSSFQALGDNMNVPYGGTRDPLPWPISTVGYSHADA